MSGSRSVEPPVIRESQTADWPLIVSLYAGAFPQEDLIPLVSALLEEEEGIVSLVSLSERLLCGHALFTRCGTEQSKAKAALLGPLAVAPERQRRGIGGALLRAGLARLEGEAVSKVFVLGDPKYYSRFGFLPESRVAPPYDLPSEWRGAWQSVTLANTPETGEDRLTVPEPWAQPALWAP